MPSIQNHDNPLVRILRLNLLDDPGLKPWSHASRNSAPLGLDQKDASALRLTCKAINEVLAEPKQAQYARIARQAAPYGRSTGPMSEGMLELGMSLVEMLDTEFKVPPYDVALALKEVQLFAVYAKKDRRSTPNTRAHALHIALAMRHRRPEEYDANANADYILAGRSQQIEGFAALVCKAAPKLLADTMGIAASSSQGIIGAASFWRVATGSFGLRPIPQATALICSGTLTAVSLASAVPLALGVGLNLHHFYVENKKAQDDAAFLKDGVICFAAGVPDDAVLKKLSNGPINHGTNIEYVSAEILGCATIAYASSVAWDLAGRALVGRPRVMVPG